MATLRIEGGRRLAGRIAVEGNKNSALPLLAACLLTDQECVLTNVPRIRDVEVLLDLLVGLGATVEGRGTSTLRVRCATVTSDRPDPALVGRLRGSVLLLGPLLARRGSARLAPPGGDFPARRTIATHLQALAAMGAVVARRARARARRAVGAERRVVLSRRSVGDRHRDGAPCRRGRARAAPRSATRRWSRTSSSSAGFCARWASRSKARARRRFASRRRRASRGATPSSRRRLHRSRELGSRRGDHRRRASR